MDDDLLQVRKNQLKNWDDRFQAKYKRKATLQDYKKFPKVEQLYIEINAAASEENMQKELILPTPTKKTSKGLFKTLSTSNVLQKRFAECLDPPAKKSKLEDTDRSLKQDSNVNVFGIPVRVALSAGLTPGVTIEESEDSLKKIVADNKGFGNSLARVNSNFSNPFAKSGSKTSQFQKVVSKLKNSVTKQEIQKSPSELPASIQWRGSKPKSTPLKKAVEKAMSIGVVGVKPVEKFVLPNQFVNHRTLKRASSFNLPLPTNYQEFLTKDEEKSLAHIIHPESGQVEDTPTNNTEPFFGTEMTTKLWSIESQDYAKQMETVIPNLPNNVVDSSKPAKKTRKSTVPKRYIKPDTDNEFDSQSESFIEKGSDQEPDSGEEIETQEKVKAAPKPKSKKRSEKAKDKVPKKKSSALTSKITTETLISTGWDSKKVAVKAGGNQNFRAFNLKAKKGGGARSSAKPKFGKNKFQKTKKLSTYNYEKSDGNYLVAGYEEREEQELDNSLIILPELKEVDTSKFVFADSADPGTDLCEISQKFGVGEKVFVDINQALKTLTGYEEFRQGQEQVIRRILAYESTLLILPTGSGKSLCFQLPAFILRHIPKVKHSMVMVVSPTISLMVHYPFNCRWIK
jgi:hypothetical protein